MMVHVHSHVWYSFSAGRKPGTLLSLEWNVTKLLVIESPGTGMVQGTNPLPATHEGSALKVRTCGHSQ